MLNILAQLATTQTEPATAPATQAATVRPFDWSLWSLTGQDILHALLVMAATLIAGGAIYFLSRGLPKRLRLRTATLVGILALAFYFAVGAIKIKRLLDPEDPLAFWITRSFAAAMVFVALRVMDRLAIVPLLTRRGQNKLPHFIHQIINILLCAFAILIFGALAFGWDIDKFLAGSAVVSIVLGLALQETLGNFFSGLVMQASPPFAIGDWIICGGHEGRVVDMTWRAVTIHTNDDNFILIPNGTVAKEDITNFHAPTTANARTVKVGLESDVSPMQAVAILAAAALETPGVQTTPPPYVYLDEYGDSAVVYQIKFWIAEPAAHHKIEHMVRVHAWYRLREKGIIIPNPTFMVEHINQSHKARRLQMAAGERFISAIEQVPLLRPLSQEQKVTLAESANDLLLAPGQILFRQNDAGDSFYVISEGQVDVLVTPEGAAERKVATLGPGDFFGEMSALTGQPRTATIRACSPLILVQVEKQDLLAIFQADPSMMEKISEIVARRNAEREAVMQGAGAEPAAEVVVKQQKSILGRMMRFFRLGNAA